MNTHESATAGSFAPGQHDDAALGKAEPALLAQLRELRANLRKSEQKVADVILAQPNSVLDWTMAELAARANVSEPSVIRFCRAAGSNGFTHFKLRLAQSLAIGVPYVHRDVKPDEPTADLAAK